MGFLRSIVLLAGVCLCIAFAYAVGHGLATHHTGPMIVGAVLLLMGAGVLAMLSRGSEKRWD
jgi:uncharacterized membrane protein HdeD (DUF308 family)